MGKGKMKIVIAHFNSHYVNTAGGVEKVTCNLANAMCRRGHEVTILYRDSETGHAYFPVDARIPEHNILYKDDAVRIVSPKLPLHLRLKREFFRLFNPRKAHEINAEAKGKAYGPAIREWLERLQPDVIVSTSMPSTKYVIEGAESKIPLVTMIHSQPAVQFSEIAPSEQRAVAKGVGIQILLPSGIDITKKYFPDLPIYVIGNAVEIPAQPVDLQAQKDKYRIVSVGVLNNNKNQKLLLEAFAELAELFPQWEMEFWGSNTGNYAKELEQYIRSHHLEDRVFLKGTSKNVNSDIYDRADIYVIPSKKEGFPLSLTEAMAAGIPAIGLCSCPGVNELIRDGETGYLTENSVNSLREKLKRLMSDRKLRVRIGEAGRKAMAEYKSDKIWEQWEFLLNSILEKGNRE